MSYMNAADLVVSMAGYNTVTELLALEKRVVLVPRIVPSLEQWIRASRLSRLGLCTALHPDQLDAESLFAAIEFTLAAPRPSTFAAGVGMDALDNVADEVNGLLTDRFTETFNRMAGIANSTLPAVQPRFACNDDTIAIAPDNQAFLRLQVVAGGVL
jgi:predicted glycosyltransferase